MFLYNICIAIYAQLIAFVGLWNNKARLWAAGRKEIFERMAAAISPSDKVVWIHVASLGEFEQGRPVIEQIKRSIPNTKSCLHSFRLRVTRFVKTTMVPTISSIFQSTPQAMQLDSST